MSVGICFHSGNEPLTIDHDDRSWTGHDLAQYTDEQDLRSSDKPSLAGIAKGYAALYPDIQKWTADELADHIKLGGMGPCIVGGPETCSDELQRWVDEADVDGFSELTNLRGSSTICLTFGTPFERPVLRDYSGNV